ncbi:sugar-binding protein [bacterium]
MDDIYKTASTERIVKLNEDDAAPPDGYLDLFAEARLLWDDTYIYIFVKVVDDEISSSSENSYENDSVEFFFDGDNSKSPEFMDDEVQVRIEYQDGDYETLYDSFPEGSEGAVADWENPVGDGFGYAVEVAIPLEGLSIDTEEGNVFGFEIQINDRDNEIRENIFRWWGASNDAWHWANLWGEAELTNYWADDALYIPLAYSNPVIDGVLDEIWMECAPAIESSTYVFTSSDVVDGSYTEIEAWEDCQMEFRVMMDSYYLYFLV